MFILHQVSGKMAVLLHKQAKVLFILIIAVYLRLKVGTLARPMFTSIKVNFERKFLKFLLTLNIKRSGATMKHIIHF